MTAIRLQYVARGVSRPYKTAVLVTKNIAHGNESDAQICRNHLDLFICLKTLRIECRQSVRYSLQRVRPSSLVQKYLRQLLPEWNRSHYDYSTNSYALKKLQRVPKPFDVIVLVPIGAD